MTTTASTTTSAPTVTTSPRTQPAARTEPTGWVGWIAFGGFMMGIAGALQMMYGLVAVVNDQWVVWNNSTHLVVDLTAWGWFHIAWGAIVLLAGIGLFSGKTFARVIAVFAASLSLIANFMFIPAYPLWALTVIALDVVVIYAIVAHGREVIDLR